MFVSKDPGGVRQLFQTERTIVIRQFGGVPSNWTDWKEVAFTTNVVNLTEPQRIGGTKEFADIPLVDGRELALKEDIFFIKRLGLMKSKQPTKIHLGKKQICFLHEKEQS